MTVSHLIIDRRLNDGGKSVGNKQKFHKRVRSHIKEQVADAIRKGDIGDIMKDGGERIRIPIKDISEPWIHHDPETGSHKRILPGNENFSQGDRFPRPKKQGGKGGGGEASDGGDGLDEFSFVLTKEEFIQFFFDDLELPDLVQKQLATQELTTPIRDGYSQSGAPSKLDYLQSMKQSIGRRVALKNPKRRKLKEHQDELETILAKIGVETDETTLSMLNDRKVYLERQIEILKRKIDAISFIDNVDLRYRHWDHRPIPIYNAAMICVMDVSGSMTELKKELAKRFYMLLYIFLHKNYEKIELVFVRHHSTAKEVDEEEFFYGRESGGTVVSSALSLVSAIIKERFPSDRWNVYIAQSSDGDNFSSDNEKVRKIMTEEILPVVQYYMYIEIETGEWGFSQDESELTSLMDSLAKTKNNIDTGYITQANEIYPVFRGLFKRK